MIRSSAVAAAALTVVVLMSHTACPMVYHVDIGGGGDFTAIKPAVQAAASGDTIQVAAGTYAGEDNRDIDFGDKNILLEGEGSVIIDCEGMGRAFELTSDQIDTSTRIRWVTIINGSARAFSEDGGGAILCQDASPIIEYCSFQLCDGEFGGAVKLLRSDAVVRYSRFEDNTADYGGAIATAYGAPFFDMNHVWGNAASVAGGAARCYRGEPRIYRMNVVLNSCAGGGAAVEFHGSPIAPDLTNSIIAFSTQGSGVSGGTSGVINHCIVYGNAGGDDLPTYAGDNLFVDPYFCSVYDYQSGVCEESQALHTVNPWGAYIGYVSVNCYAPCESPVEGTSWGMVKSLYREERGVAAQEGLTPRSSLEDRRTEDSN